jgi:hypothetical protein
MRLFRRMFLRELCRSRRSCCAGPWRSSAPFSPAGSYAP